MSRLAAATVTLFVALAAQCAPALAAAISTPAVAATSTQSTGTTAAAPPAAVKPRTSLPVIERQVMCVTCKIPLNVAQSPQADRERAFIQGLIDRGYGEAEVKRALVAQYGPAALGLPRDQGFDVTAYVVPLVVVLALLAMLALLLPSWRRHARASEPATAPAAKLDASDAARLESDIARFD
jgi:cytochrome c-type biogenesis protein CcmH